MTHLDDLWYLADEARRRAEQAYYRLRDSYGDYLEREDTRHVSRRRFRTLADRIQSTGAPYGAHTIVYQPSGQVLLVRDTVADQWVLPGGAQEGEESYLAAARRELAEEAGVEADYDGLGYVSRVTIRAEEYETWGVLPVFAAEATTYEPDVSDPDGEVVDARWFDELPEDTRDRRDLEKWRGWALE